MRIRNLMRIFKCKRGGCPEKTHTLLKKPESEHAARHPAGCGGKGGGDPKLAVSQESKLLDGRVDHEDARVVAIRISGDQEETQPFGVIPGG